MWTRFTRKYSVATKKPRTVKQRGQAILEYLVILAFITSIFLVVVRPYLGKLQKKIQDGVKSDGFFSLDVEGSGFYYFPVK